MWKIKNFRENTSVKMEVLDLCYDKNFQLSWSKLEVLNLCYDNTSTLLKINFVPTWLVTYKVKSNETTPKVK